MTAVLNPRLRVSNNYKVFKYTGELLHHVDFSHSELYDVNWKPGTLRFHFFIKFLAKFFDRPASPVKKLTKKENEPQAENDKTDSEKQGEKKLFRPKVGGPIIFLL